MDLFGKPDIDANEFGDVLIDPEEDSNFLIPVSNREFSESGEDGTDGNEES